jgi:hypothetical protein
MQQPEKKLPKLHDFRFLKLSRSSQNDAQQFLDDHFGSDGGLNDEIDLLADER